MGKRKKTKAASAQLTQAPERIAGPARHGKNLRGSRLYYSNAPAFKRALTQA